MKVTHTRTVEIVTFTVTCDHCGTTTRAMGRDALHSAGWTIGASDTCPDCHFGMEQEAYRREADAATAAYIATLERDEVPLVHGRIYAERAWRPTAGQQPSERPAPTDETP